MLLHTIVNSYVYYSVVSAAFKLALSKHCNSTVDLIIFIVMRNGKDTAVSLYKHLMNLVNIYTFPLLF